MINRTLTEHFIIQSDWMENEAGLNEYVNIVHHCFDVYLALAILRLDSGCDFSKVIGEEEQITINQEGDAGNGTKKEDDEEISEDGKTKSFIFLTLRFYFLIQLFKLSCKGS